jgi:hypothetical protein
VGKAAMAEIPQGTRGGFWVGVMLTLEVKPQWVRYKLDETIEQSCSDFLTHTLEVCKSARRYNGWVIRLSEDNHDSWVTCTTSAECKTVITTVLTVMSGIDPHMIRWKPWVWLDWFGWFVEVDLIRWWVGHGETP